MLQLTSYLGEGRTAEIFRMADGRVLKLYYDWCPESWAQREYQVTRSAYDAGVPAPRVDALSEHEGRFGLIVEYIEGVSLLQQMFSTPQAVLEAAGILADLHVRMHDQTLPAEFPDLRSQLRFMLAGLPTEHQQPAQTALAALDRLPDGDRICHGDFHPGNIMMTAGHPLVIDWMTATRGCPLGDVARTVLLLSIASPPPGLPVELFNTMRQAFIDAYLVAYRRQRPFADAELHVWLFPVAAARLWEKIPDEKEAVYRMLALYM